MSQNPLIAVGLLVLLGIGAISACSKPTPRRDVIWGLETDPAVAAASALALKTLPIFWRHFDAKAANTDEFYLKVPFKTQQGGEEHMWVEPMTRASTEVIGRLMDEPEDVAGVKRGDQVRFPSDHISDWTYARDGKSYGHFVTRVLMDRFAPKERKIAARQLSATPLEAEDQ